MPRQSSRSSPEQKEADFDNPMREPWQQEGSRSDSGEESNNEDSPGGRVNGHLRLTRGRSTLFGQVAEPVAETCARGLAVMFKSSLSTSHSSLRVAKDSEFHKLGTTREEALKFPELQSLRRHGSHFPEDYVPTDRLLLHLATVHEGRSLQVTPEMVQRVNEDEAASRQQTCVKGPDSLAMALFSWAYADKDIPHNMLVDEMNAVHRKMIADTILLDPACSLRSWWDVTQMVLLMSLAIMLPVEVGFALEDPPLWSLSFFLTLAVDLYFLADIFMSFITCTYADDGLLITDKRVLFVRYLKGWFILDLLACFPAGYIGYITESQNEVAVSIGDTPIDLKMLRLVKLVKLLRLARVKRLISKYETKFYEVFQRIKQFSQLLMVLMVAHVFACCWQFIGTVNEKQGQGWVTDWVSRRMDLFPNYNGSVTPLLETNLIDLYLGGYYQSIRTLIAGNVPSDLVDATVAEVIFSLFALVAGGYVYGTIIGNITELARKANAETNIADQVQNEARAMCRGRADTFLTNRIMQHFQYNLERSPATDVLSFLRCLPGELEMEFAAQCGWIPRRLHGMAQNGMLFKVPFFNPLDNRSKIYLCSKMKVCIVQEYVKDSIAAVVSADARPITVEGQPSSDFYVILSGKVAVEQTHRRIGTLEQGHFFGEYNILLPQRLGSFGQLQSRTTYAVNGDCELCALGYEDFQELRRERPAINEAVLPYIEESMGHEMHSNRWFYVEMKSASGLRASDASTLEADGLSDPYCVMFLNNHIVGKTPVHFRTLDPVWVTTVALAHSAMEELQLKHGDVNLRFEIYDFDGVGDPDFLGGAETTLSKLSGLRDFRQFGPNAEDVVTELPLYDTSGLASPDPGEDAENLGSVTVVLTNYDWTQHVHSQLNAPAVLADVNRRRKLQSQRHIHLTHEAAALHRLQSDVDGLVTNMTAMDAKMATMDAKMDAIMSLLQSR